MFSPSWQFFKTFISNVEMTLSKTDLAIARHYVNRLVEPVAAPLLRRRGAPSTICTVGEIANLTQEWGPVGGPAGAASARIEVRDAYLDPINVLQVELLARVPSAANNPSPPPNGCAGRLLLTVNGVAAGLRNTG